MDLTRHRASIRSLLGSLALAFSTTMAASATDFHVDPATGSPSGDGSLASPWRTLQEVVEGGLIETRVWETLPYVPGAPFEVVNPGAPVRAGDTLWLRDGHHGELSVRGAYNETPITIAAQPGHQPTLARVKLTAVQNWRFTGLTISPAYADPPATGGTLFEVENHGFWGPSWDVTLERSDLFTVDDSATWGVDDWLAAASGIHLEGDRVAAIGNTVRNVRHGITVTGDDTLIASNRIDGFSADGMRGLGDRAVFEYNRVQNCHVSSGQGDGNHDDGFQSWSVGPDGVGTGEVTDVTLRGNTFINHVDPHHPLRSTMQAIGCFDGLFVRWIVENNLVITDHWHGITFHGLIDSRIVNNTVIDLNDTTPGPPWIRITESNGTPSQNVVIRNNLATDFSIGGTSITDDHNLEFSDASAHFVAPPYDLRLRTGSPAIDGGNPLLAPTRDIVGIPRPQGAAPDLGAHERCPSCLFVSGFESGHTLDWTHAVP